jgi:hypothetical protein
MRSRGGMLTYGLPERSAVSLRIYSLQGKLISSVVEQVQQPGYYTVRLQLPERANGYHVIVFRAGSFVVKKQLIVLK